MTIVLIILYVICSFLTFAVEKDLETEGMFDGWTSWQRALIRITYMIFWPIYAFAALIIALYYFFKWFWVALFE